MWPFFTAALDDRDNFSLSLFSEREKATTLA